MADGAAIGSGGGGAADACDEAETCRTISFRAMCVVWLNCGVLLVWGTKGLCIVLQSSTTPLHNSTAPLASKHHCQATLSNHAGGFHVLLLSTARSRVAKGAWCTAGSLFVVYCRQPTRPVETQAMNNQQCMHWTILASLWITTVHRRTSTVSWMCWCTSKRPSIRYDCLPRQAPD